VGLDWNPGNKAKQGHEAEFTEVLRRLLASKPGPDRDALEGRFHNISVTAFETLRAPRVGRDPEADAWARRVYREEAREESVEEFLRELEGFWVLDLVPPCDGLPRYSNGSPGGYVEAYAFRAQFLHDCEDELGEELLASAYESKLPDEMLAYGRRLLAVANELARRHGVDPHNLVVPDEFPTMEEFAAGKTGPTTLSPEHRIDVMHSAGRWCVFWAERGHFLDAYW
jgi:hypothetical protein